MSELAENGYAVLFTSSLSRISRHLGKLMQVMEYLLSHDVPILTANYLVRPHEVWVRRGELVPVDREDLLAAWWVSRGLSGVHRAMVATVVKRLEAEKSASENWRRIAERLLELAVGVYLSGAACNWP